MTQKDNKTTTQQPIKDVRKQEGKYVDLPGAEMGKVVVRFPPEASGYLHIGHAKAALLNQYYQLAFQGKLVFRFDDTNPEKEKEDYEHVIREDVAMLQIKPDVCSYTSDYFDLYIEMIEMLIKKGMAYVDDTPADVMKAEREARKESANRSNSVDKNMSLWDEMKKGTELGQRCCVRAKIDMNSDNGCLRDPAFYRCKKAEHPRTKDKYCVYPTYDFACPIIDSIEGITHALRTTEYVDRDVQYQWVLNALELKNKPHIVSYSRLNMLNTVLSKRKLTWFVDNKVVEGWDDPRMPTVRGVLRRGMTVEGLKQFIIAQGSSRAAVFMEWDKIWSFNKKVIDAQARRYAAVGIDSVPVEVIDGPEGTSIDVAVHPKNTELGKRPVKIGQILRIDLVDAEAIKEGDSVTFVNWGNLLVSKIAKDKSGRITGIKVKLNLDDKDFKKTYKTTWVASTYASRATFVYYDHLIAKALMGKDDDFKDYMNKDSKFEIDMLVEEPVAKLKKGDIIQVLRKGFFICDVPETETTVARLISIPDGSTDMNIFPTKVREWKERNQKIAAQFDVKKEVPKVTGPAPGAAAILNDIKSVGDEIRNLKSNKADKAAIDAKVKSLLALKQKYKEVTGTEWTPNAAPPTVAHPTPTAPSAANGVDSILADIKTVGDEIRQLKSNKADKAAIDAKVESLLALKQKYKEVTGTEWSPNAAPPPAQPSPAVTPATTGADSILAEIKAVGDEIRTLKAAKADKSVIDGKVKSLLALKQKYKEITGTEWSPNVASSPAQPAPAPVSGDAGSVIDQKIKDQGDKIRDLKTAKKSKEELQPEIDKLLALKVEFKNVTGKDWQPAAGGNARSSQPKQEKPKSEAPPKQKQEKPKKQPKAAPVKAGDESGPKKQTRLGLETKKSENFADWYTEVITKSEMIEYYDVSGCYILRPWSYAIWEFIQSFMDKRLKREGVRNCYFPMFVTAAALEREKDHIADFAPEVAWVTKSGQSEMQEPIAIRPTSETVMYPSYAKWVQSHRDLPIRLNQWCNIVRWEFKNPTPFLRTREFLWQEGHSAWADKDEAVKEVYTMLDIYAATYEELLAVPVIKGTKTEKEKFPGGDFTTTIEGFIPANGRGIQAATSHHLGQNFSKMFEIIFEDPNEIGSKRYAYQNSYGFTTRSIGSMIMVHSDDKGLVLPPRVASIQVIITPCGLTANTKDEERKTLLDACTKLKNELSDGDLRVETDFRDHVSPGWKYNHWELKGVPLRIELGPKDLSNKQFIAVRRDSGLKLTVPMANGVKDVSQILEDIQNGLFTKAKAEYDSSVVTVHNWNDFLTNLNNKKLLLTPFCGDPECEELIKKNSTVDDPTIAGGGQLMGAKSLCIPQKQPRDISPSDKCVNSSCKSKPKFYTLFGRSY